MTRATGGVIARSDSDEAIQSLLQAALDCFAGARNDEEPDYSTAGFGSAVFVWSGGASAWVRPSHGIQVSCAAFIQNANGLAASRYRPKASNEGIACRWIEIIGIGIRRTAMLDRDVETGQMSHGEGSVSVMRDVGHELSPSLPAAFASIQYRALATPLRPLIVFPRVEAVCGLSKRFV